HPPAPGGFRPSLGRGRALVRLSTTKRRSDMCNMPTAHHQIRPLRSRVLVVEDHRDVLHAMTRLFTIDGYEVLPAANVAEAFDCLELQPDMVVTDLLLPDGDGVDVLRRARRYREGSLPVALYTAAGDERLREVFAAIGPEA